MFQCMGFGSIDESVIDLSINDAETALVGYHVDRVISLNSSPMTQNRIWSLTMSISSHLCALYE